MTNPWPLQKDAIQFYGDPRQEDWFAKNMVKVVPPYPITYQSKLVKTIFMHRKCAASFKQVLDSISAAYSRYGAQMLAKMKEDGVTVYDGSYNLRVISGSSRLSMHSYGCAVDFDAAHNGFTRDRHAGKFKPDSIIVQAFKAQNWRWGGDYLGRRDPMHFEAVK